MRTERRSWLRSTAVWTNVAFPVLLVLNAVYFGWIWDVHGGACLFGDTRGCRDQMIFLYSFLICAAWIVADLVLLVVFVVRSFWGQVAHYEPPTPPTTPS